MATVEKPILRKITRGYQITLPHEFRDRYHIHIGDYVEIIEKDGQLVISPLNVEREKIAADLARLFNDNPETELADDEAMILAIQEIKAARAERKKHSSVYEE